MPGLVDLHIHGAYGVDLLTAGPEDLDRLATSLEERGISGFLPTLAAASLDALRKAAGRISGWIVGRRKGDGRGALPLGIHFEGPFLSPERCGALRVDSLLDGRAENVTAFLGAIGTPPGRGMVTVAPEIPGGIDLVRELSRRGFVVALGHTAASTALLDEAFEAGARHMTHLGNAMGPFHHRDVGPVGWGLLRDDVTVDLIADLRHLAPEMIRLVFKAKGAGRVALVSDAIPAAGLEHARRATLSLWGEEVIVDGREARTGRGNLAGSLCLLDEAVENLASIGVPRDVAAGSARDVPRRILGI